MLVFFIFIFFTLLLLFLSLVISIKKQSRNKSTSYECGFDPIANNSISFSLHFFKLLLVFLLFDLEVVFFLGFIFGSVESIFLFFVYLFLVIGTYYLERNIGVLN